MDGRVDLARQQWEEGYRRLQAEADEADVYSRLLEQVEIVTAELRRRVGGGFTLSELAVAYQDADTWAKLAIAARSSRPGWARSAATAADAAFHLYARGARDYRP